MNEVTIINGQSVEFEVLANGYKFTGTFIDALEYIKANFKVVDDAHL